MTNQSLINHSNQPPVNRLSYVSFMRQLTSNTPNFRSKENHDIQDIDAKLKPVLEPENNEIDVTINGLKFITEHLDALDSNARTYIISHWEELNAKIKQLVHHYELNCDYAEELDNILTNHKCPITQHVSPQYVSTSKNTNYDAEAIYRWLQTSTRDPLTNQIVDPVLYPNHEQDQALNEAIKQTINPLMEDLANEAQNLNQNRGPSQ